jgi:hypothetical protein
MKFGKIPYLGDISNKVGKQLSKYGIRPAYYSKGTIGRLLVNNKLDKFEKSQSCGVYELQCSKCNISYIGQTGRTFLTRFKEHTNLRKKEVGDEGLSSSFANHLLNTGHDCTISNLSVLHVEQKGRKLDTLEILEIARANKVGKALCNEQLEFKISPLLAIARDYNWG